MKGITARIITIMMVALIVPLSLCAEAIDDFRESKSINAPQAAVLVIDLSDGKIVAEHNADKSLLPASIMKCVTIAGLLQQTGPEWHYKTPVYRTGEIVRRVLEGNVVVKGSGDPSVNTRHEPGSEDICKEIAAALVEVGVDSIRGRIMIDEEIFSGPATPSSWAKDDLSQSYGTGSHAFNFEDNASGKSSVSNPSGVFLLRLSKVLSENGIVVQGAEVKDGKREELVTHVSASIDEIMRSCMMRSDNQFAEAFARTIAVVQGETGSTAKGVEMNANYWKHKKAPMDGVKLVDGSGLSRQNRVTARFMANVLQQMSENVYYASFFPLAGQEGTLRNFLKDTPLDSYVAMKTGSMRGIQCYAGYKLDEDYAPTHIIVVIMNEMGDRGAARAEVSKLLLSIFCPETLDETTGNENVSE